MDLLPAQTYHTCSIISDKEKFTRKIPGCVRLSEASVGNLALMMGRKRLKAVGMPIYIEPT